MRSSHACILLSRLMAGKRTYSSYDLPRRRLHENFFFPCLKLCCHLYITGSYASLSMETKMGNTDIYQFTKQLSNIFSYTKPYRGYMLRCKYWNGRIPRYCKKRGRVANTYCTRISTHPQVEMSHIIKGISDILQRLATKGKVVTIYNTSVIPHWHIWLWSTPPPPGPTNQESSWITQENKHNHWKYWLPQQAATLSARVTKSPSTNEGRRTEEQYVLFSKWVPSEQTHLAGSYFSVFTDKCGSFHHVLMNIDFPDFIIPCAPPRNSVIRQFRHLFGHT